MNNIPPNYSLKELGIEGNPEEEQKAYEEWYDIAEAEATGN